MCPWLQYNMCFLYYACRILFSDTQRNSYMQVCTLHCECGLYCCSILWTLSIDMMRYDYPCYIKGDWLDLIIVIYLELIDFHHNITAFVYRIDDELDPKYADVPGCTQWPYYTKLAKKRHPCQCKYFLLIIMCWVHYYNPICLFWQSSK